MSPFTKVKMSPYVEAESGQNIQNERKRDQENRNHEPSSAETNHPESSRRTIGNKHSANKADMEEIPGTRGGRVNPQKSRKTEPQPNERRKQEEGIRPHHGKLS